MFINNIEELKKYKKEIELLYSKFGKTYEQSYDSLYIKMSLNPLLKIIFDGKILFALKPKIDGVWQSEIESFPVLMDPKQSNNSYIIELLYNAMEQLKIDSVYFPLVYENSLAYKALCEVNCGVCKRLPTSIVLPENPKPEGHIDKLIKKNKYKFNKRKKMFEDNCVVKHFEVGTAKRYIQDIENGSWKHQYGMDMKQRNQLDYYSKMIENGKMDIVYAVEKCSGKPIAYRLDAIVNGIVYQVKTSYNKQFAKLTPGIYLNTINLFETYDGMGYNYIDLYGSPNTMKDEIEDCRINRFDLYFPSINKKCEEIMTERKSYDSKFLECYEKRLGIQNMWRENNDTWIKN